MSPHGDKASGPLDPAPSADRGDGKDKSIDRLGVEAGPTPTIPQNESSPAGPPTEAYTSESPPVEQDAANDSG
jgi:hypothetical protein